MPQPSHVNVVRPKWVYYIKQQGDGTPDRFKASGFTQVSGQDHDEIFSPIVFLTTINLIIALALSSNWTLEQLDVKNAFLHNNLKETIYIEQPLGFSYPININYVCLLQKFLYRLEHAPRA